MASFISNPTTILVTFVLLALAALFLARPTDVVRSFVNRHILRKASQPASAIIDLKVYPIKSCRGVSVRETVLLQHGLDLDRQWMFVDATTRDFLTIRQIPKMTLVNTAISADGKKLNLSVTGMDRTVSIDTHPSEDWLAEHTTLLPAKIWDAETDGYAYGAEVNDMFSSFFERDVSLVYKGPTPRILGGNGSPERLGRTQSTYFPDVLPVLIASEASLQDLNVRLKGKGSDSITIERFRPNIIIKGNTPWIEDSWKTVQLSEKGARDSQRLRLDVVARCARCQVPNVHPDTAIKDKKEPWNTLMSFRRVDPGITYKPCFGMLSVPRNEGTVAVGMDLQVLEETDSHRYVAGF